MDLPRDGFSPDNGSERRYSLRRRHAIGRAHFGEVLGWWFAKGKLSHKRIEMISTWIHRDRNVVASSQVSHIRNATLANPNWVLIEGIANVNTAIHLWQTSGPRECFRVYGPFGKGIEGEAAMDEAIWLPLPNEDQPLRFRHWCEIFAGMLELPYVDEVIISPGSASRLNEELAALLERVILQSGLTFRDGLQRFMGFYPVTDESRRSRLQSYAMGREVLETEQIRLELASIATAIERMRDLEPGSYGPQNLWREMTSNRKRT